MPAWNAVDKDVVEICSSHGVLSSKSKPHKITYYQKKGNE